jgi:aspartyl-tRNA(Asn)/glutamyl-tRNA(Gln) amidotransferase subunit A
VSLNAGSTAREIVLAIHGGSASVREVEEAHLDQIAAYDHQIKAFETVNQDLVRKEADWLDAQRAAGARLPLHGVPIAVKDIIDVAGLPTIAGFEPYRSNIAGADAEIIKRLRANGALIIGKTHTTQFAVGDPAPTRNPWNLDKSPAGSSAGSGAAVPARMAPVALGSQTAGSMLRPAAFNGSVGFKPTFGWMPLGGVIPLCWSLDHLGLYTATVEDMNLVYRKLKPSRVFARESPGRPRIALLPEYLAMSEPEVMSHVRDVARKLEQAGAIVDEVDLPVPFDDIFAVHQVIFSAEMSAVHSTNLSRYTDDYGPRIRTGVEAGSLVPANFLLKAHRLQRRLMTQVDGWMRQYDAVMLPTVSTEACDRVETGDRRFQVPATLLGLPAVSLPTGMGPSNLPLATQLISRARDESALLDIASMVEEEVGLIGRPTLDS